MTWVLVYLAAIVAANFSVATFGPAVTPVNAFFLIALDLVCRDRLHDAWQRRGLVVKMAGLIAAGGLISYALNPATGQIAIASSVAFVLAGLADALTYDRLIRHPWLLRSNGSNVVGAAVDSLVFPTLAFGVLMPGIVLAQFAAKMLGGLFWSLVLSVFVRRPVETIP